MNARIPLYASIPKHIAKAASEYAKELAQQEIQRGIDRQTHNILKLICYSLHTEAGWGQGRLLRLIGRINTLIEEESHNEDFWRIIDDVLIKECKLPFDRDYSIYDKAPLRE